jgi:ABC-2 type transport system permease protein
MLFGAFVRQAYMNASAYRVHFFVEIFSRFLQLYVLTTLWHLLYRQAPGAFAGTPEPSMITYACLGVIVSLVLSADTGPHTYIAEQVRRGTITGDLIKPLDFVAHMLWRNLGETVVRAVFYAVVPFVGAVILFGVRAPQNGQALAGFVLSMLLSVLILFYCNFLFGLISFKTLDLTGFQFAYWALIRFFSGALIPVWLYPPYLAKGIQWLPFQSVYATPISIYIGRLTGEEMVKGLSLQILWILLLGLLAAFLWNRIHRHLIVQGG